MNTYQSISLLTKIGDGTILDSVLSMSVEASAKSQPRVLRLLLNDPTDEIKALALVGSEMSFSWSFDGDTPIQIFSGSILKADLTKPHEVNITAHDLWNKIATVRHTLTYSKMPAPDMLKELIGTELAIPTGRIFDLDNWLDRLPLFRMTAAQGIDAVNRKLGLDYLSFVDEDGIFVWMPKDYTADPITTLIEDEDIFELDMKETLFMTWGREIRLAGLYEIAPVDADPFKAILTGLNYEFGNKGSLITAGFEQEAV